MSQTEFIPNSAASENSKKAAENVQSTAADMAWIRALPHFLGAFSIFTAYLGFLCPLFLWLATKDEDAEVAAECHKALNFQGAYFIFYLLFSLAVQGIAIFVTTEPKIILLLKVFGHISIVASLFVFGFSLLAGYKVSKGRSARYPIGIDLISIFNRY